MLVDLKTTSAIYPKHWMQVGAYAKLAEKTYGIKIAETAILRLTPKTKKGYQYETTDVWQADYSAFSDLLSVWRHLNGDKQPVVEELPDVLSL